MIVKDRISVGLSALIVSLFLMFGASAVFADETGNIVVLVGGMDGPDPDTYPVTETVSRWIQSIFPADSGIEFRIHDSVVQLDEFSDFYLEAYEAGVDKVVVGIYDIEGSNVLVSLASSGISAEGLGSNLELEVDDSGAVTFSVDMLNGQSSPPAGIRFFAHSLAGSIFDSLGEYEKAVTEFSYAIEYAIGISDSDLSRVYSHRAYLLGKEFDNPTAALTDYDIALELDITNDTALANRAYVLWLLMRYEEAFEAYSTRIEIQPDSADAYSDRAVFLTEMGYLDDALSDYIIAVELAPENPAYHYNLGLCYTYKQELEKAVQTFSDLIEWCPEHLDAQVDRAIVQINLGEWEAAHQNLLQSLEVDDSFARVYNGLVLTSMYLEQWDDALEYAETGEILAPTDQNFPKVAGSVYMRMGDFDSALIEFQRAYEVIMTFHDGLDDPSSPVENLVDLIDDLRELSEMDRNSSEYFIARGDQFSVVRVFDKAAEEYSEAIRLDPDSEDGYYLRGLCCMETGDTEQAITDMETVLSMTTSPHRERMAEQNLRLLSE